MASVFIGDLDDFITPSQACVNPIFAGTANQAQPTQAQGQQGDGAGDQGRAKVTLAASWMEEGGVAVEAAPVAPVRPDLIKVKAGQGQGAPAAATVSLNDCLACRCVGASGGVYEGLGDGLAPATWTVVE